MGIAVHLIPSHVEARAVGAEDGIGGVEQVGFGVIGAFRDDFFRVGPSYGFSACMFCGRRFSDNENYYQERETDAARNYKEGVYEVKFSDGSKLLRKFLYKHLPGDNPGFESATEIAAFVGDDSDGYAKFDGLSIVEEYAYDEDGNVWGAKWLPSYDYGRLAEIKHTPVFYFSDEVFFA